MMIRINALVSATVITFYRPVHMVVVIIITLYNFAE